MINLVSDSLLKDYVSGHKPFLLVMEIIFGGGMWALPYSRDTIDTNLTDEDGAAERVLLNMKNRRNLYERQNPDMSDIFIHLPWTLQILEGGPPDTPDRPSSMRIRIDDETRR
eukprot:5183590-Karenia_brevis.AAC.1